MDTVFDVRARESIWECLELGEVGAVRVELSCSEEADRVPAAAFRQPEPETPDCFYCGTEAGLVSLE